MLKRVTEISLTVPTHKFSRDRLGILTVSILAAVGILEEELSHARYTPEPNRRVDQDSAYEAVQASMLKKMQCMRPHVKASVKSSAETSDRILSVIVKTPMFSRN